MECDLRSEGNTRACRRQVDEAIGKALDDEAIRKRLLELGSVIPAPAERTPEALAALVKSEIAKWTPVLKPAS